MKMVKRWGVMTLVALLVLGTMGAALADDGVETETETAKELLTPGSYEFVPAWAQTLVTFVFYWGGDAEKPDCAASGVAPSGGIFFAPPATTGDAASQCAPLYVEKNGHVNHGSMVSSFVHWLKDGNLDELIENNPDLKSLQDMPKGQLVKEFAHLDFGKGFFELPTEDGPAAADVEADEAEESEESDGHGQPAWVKDKKADKPAKGKNK